MQALRIHKSHMEALMLMIVDLVTMGAIPFTINQPHCLNSACQAPTQTPPRSSDTSSSMIAPYFWGGKVLNCEKNVEIHEMARCPVILLSLAGSPTPLACLDR